MYNNYYSLHDVQQRSLVLSFFHLTVAAPRRTYWRQTLEKFCARTVYTRRNLLRRDTRVLSRHVSHGMCTYYICCGRHEDHRRDSSNICFFFFFFLLRRPLLSRKEIHGRRRLLPSLARFATERGIEKVRNTSCGDIVGVILSLSHTTARVTRYTRGIDFSAFTRDWMGCISPPRSMCIVALDVARVLDGINIGGNDKRRRFWKSLYYTTDTQGVSS